MPTLQEQLRSSRFPVALAHAPVVQNQPLRGTSSWANRWLGRDHTARHTRAIRPPQPTSTGG